MIEWLAGCVTDFPVIDTDAGLSEWLDPVELDIFHALKVEKRRGDWLLGRLAAKTLLGNVLQQRYQVFVPPGALKLLPDESGAPRAVCNFSGLPANLPYSISISHSNKRALAGALYVGDRAAFLGVDIEKIEPRPEGFAEDYFTEREAAFLKRSAVSGYEEALAQTAIWSLKEAVLKALRLGLVVDTRCVETYVHPLPPPVNEWQKVQVWLDPKLFMKPDPEMSCWWRVEDDFVMACALASYR